MELILLLFMCLQGLVSSNPVASKVYRSDYKLISNEGIQSFYKVHTKRASLRRAEELCSLEGAKLFKPANDVELKELLSVVNSSTFDEFWVGGHLQENNPQPWNLDRDDDDDFLRSISLNDHEHKCNFTNTLGEVTNNMSCSIPFSFVCKVDAKDVPYDKICDVYDTAAFAPFVSKIYRSDYVYLNYFNVESFFKFHSEEVDYSRATEICKFEGAILFGPINTDANDKDDLIHVVEKITKLEGQQIWVTNDETEGYSDYDAYHDETYDYGLSNKNCSIIKASNDSYNLDVSYEEDCNAKHAFICEVIVWDASYDEQCQVYDVGFLYSADVGSCYKIADVSMTWDEASDQCEAIGSHLVILNSELEMLVVQELMQNSASISLLNWKAFAGFRNNGENGQFTTIFNQSLEETGYSEIYDNYDHDFQNSNFCGIIQTTNKMFEATNCDDNNFFICEKEIDQPELRASDDDINAIMPRRPLPIFTPSTKDETLNRRESFQPTKSWLSLLLSPNVSSSRSSWDGINVTTISSLTSVQSNDIPTSTNWLNLLLSPNVSSSRSSWNGINLTTISPLSSVQSNDIPTSTRWLNLLLSPNVSSSRWSWDGINVTTISPLSSVQSNDIPTSTSWLNLLLSPNVSLSRQSWDEKNVTKNSLQSSVHSNDIPTSTRWLNLLLSPNVSSSRPSWDEINLTTISPLSSVQSNDIPKSTNWLNLLLSPNVSSSRSSWDGINVTTTSTLSSVQSNDIPKSTNWLNLLLSPNVSSSKNQVNDTLQYLTQIPYNSQVSEWEPLLVTEIYQTEKSIQKNQASITRTMMTSTRNVYRSDYVFDSDTNAFYKVHLNAAYLTRAEEMCRLEGGKLWIPNDLYLLRKLTQSMNTNIHFLAGKPDYAERVDQCFVVSKFSELSLEDSDGCVQPFICKVEAENAPYDELCNVYDSGYEYVAELNSCYKISDVLMSWKEASAQCQAVGCDLVHINSEEELQIVANMTINTIGIYRWILDSCIIVGTDTSEEFVTSVYPHEQLEEACAGICYKYLVANISCDKQSRFMCEKNLKSTSSATSISSKGMINNPILIIISVFAPFILLK